MARTVEEIMTHDPRTVDADAPLVEAAREMRDGDVGDVIVTRDGHVNGIVTDRDIAVRAVADGRDLQSTPVSEVCTSDVRALQPSQSIDEAVQAMREHDIRRVPVVDGGRPVGIVSLGDLAVERDPDSALRTPRSPTSRPRRRTSERARARRGSLPRARRGSLGRPGTSPRPEQPGG